MMTIVVPLDGTEQTARAIGPAIELARCLDAGLALFAIAGDDDVEDVVSCLDRLAAAITDCPVETIVDQGHDPGAFVPAVASLPAAVVCMVSDFGAGAGELLSPLADDIIHAGVAPVLLLGPACHGTRLTGPDHRQAIACADGAAAGSSIEPLVTTWATALGLGVHLLTVVHPRHDHQDGVTLHHVHHDIDSRADRLQRHGLAVTTQTVHDDVDLADVVQHHVERHPVALVALGTRPDGSRADAVAGDPTRALLDTVSVPVLVAGP